MSKIIKIGTRESQLAVWQASLVQQLLSQYHIPSELVFIKSDGDIDLVTPLYELGVQGIFTKTLDAALLSKRIDIAVHSMKDVPTQLARGIAQAAVLPRASFKDLLVFKGDEPPLFDAPVIATSSIRRKAQWLHKFPNTVIENLRGNVNSRLRKLDESKWNGAIFAAAGLERIGLRPEKSIELDWMLPAPAQGAIMIVCNDDDDYSKQACALLNDEATALCTRIEKDFLRGLMGGCSTPISALAVIEDGQVCFRGNIFSPDGTSYAETEMKVPIPAAAETGITAADEVLRKGGSNIAAAIRHETK
ncbi:MAG TPA: hydroxymethylbilane synthase [Panacibacter sp.]|nr:hydroxymethylbilane synthase [Panacibacter sp.]HNP46872.1 hydroxymethylbilane synthase [Panacibacter sp.]